MALPVSTQIRIWGVALAVFVAVMWLLGDVLLPFVIGGAVAYFLDPVADRLEEAGFSRAAATALITVVAVLLFVMAALAVLPALTSQLAELIQTAPALFEQLHAVLSSRFPSLESELNQSLQNIGETVRTRGGELLSTVLTSAAGVINVLMLFVIVPVVSVYMLLDWDNMVAQIDRLLPLDHAPTIRHLAAEIDKTLSSFVRGMGTVCLILGAYYAVALMLVGLNFGLVVGFIAGLVTFIPYLGAIIGGVLAIGLALFQYWGVVPMDDGTMGTDWIRIAIVAAIFFIGQFLEGNLLTPRLVGKSVGLHPVWLLLALSVFGTLFGFVGMLVAVPVAAALGVLARYATDRYLEGRLYTGLTGRKDDAG